MVFCVLNVSDALGISLSQSQLFQINFDSWTQVSFAARLPREAEIENKETETKVEKKTETTTEKKACDSSEELTKEDVEKLRKEMKEILPEEQADKFADILNKFTNNASSDEMVEGFVSSHIHWIKWRIFIDDIKQF